MLCPKQYPCLLRPRQNRALHQFNDRHGCDLPLIDQPFQHLERQIGEPQLPADMALSEVHGDFEIMHRTELACLYTPPPPPRLADCA